MINFHLSKQALDQIKVDCTVVFLFSDQKPLKGNAALIDWRLNGRLSQCLIKGWFEAKAGEVMIMPSEARLDSKELFLVGLGPSQKFDAIENLGQLLQFIIDKLSPKKTESLAFSFSELFPSPFQWRNAVRMLLYKLTAHPTIQEIYVTESPKWTEDAKIRHMDFGHYVNYTFESEF